MASLSSHPLLRALGGVLGIFESLIPSLLFVIVYSITATSGTMPILAIALSGGASAIFIVIRLIRREGVTQAVAGLVAVIASFLLALLSGRAENNFLIGIWTNAAYLLAFIISLFVRWPLVGIGVGLFTKRGHGWRSDRKLFRLMMWLTLVWAGMFALRLAIEVPLFLASNVGALGIAKLVLGLPLYAPVVLMTWLFVRGMFIEESTTSA
jgi:MFS family permease